MKKLKILLFLAAVFSFGVSAMADDANTHLAFFNFTDANSANQTQNGVTVSVSGVNKTGTSTYTAFNTSATLEDLDANVSSTGNFTTSTIQSYIGANKSDITITLSGLTAGHKYNVSMVTGLDFEGSGSWNHVSTENAYDSTPSTSLALNVTGGNIPVRALGAFLIEGIVADASGNITLKVVSTNKSHSGVVNCLGIAKQPVTYDVVSNQANGGITFEDTNVTNGNSMTTSHVVNADNVTAIDLSGEGFPYSNIEFGTNTITVTYSQAMATYNIVSTGAGDNEGGVTYNSEQHQAGTNFSAADGLTAASFTAIPIDNYEIVGIEVAGSELSYTVTVTYQKIVYPINFDKNQKYTRSGNDRYLKQIKLGDQTIDVDWSTSPKGNINAYQDLTSDETKRFTVEPGASVVPGFTWQGAWMKGVVYLDEGKDGSFVDDAVTPTGENAIRVDNGTFSAFTVPTEVGEYRMRYLVDWPTTDEPAGRLGDDGTPTGNNGILANGGSITDVILVVKAYDLDEAKANMKTKYASYTFGEGLGEYNFGQTSYNFNDAVDACADRETLEALEDAISINQPALNKFYRVKGGVTGKYATMATENAQMTMISDADESTIFYLDDQSRFIGYKLGLGLNSTYWVGEVSDTKETVTFTESQYKVGKYCLKSNFSASKIWYDNGNHATPKVDRNASENSANCSWDLEEVTELPLALSNVNDVYYSTIYLPVAATVDGAEVYYVGESREKVEGHLGTYQVTDAVVAANKGYILCGTNENITISLNDPTPTETDSYLTGKLAKEETSDENVRVFSKKNNDAEKVGFYKLPSGTTTLKAFRAFYQAPDASVAAYELDFEGTTGIIANMLNKKTVEGAYDLQGRKVNNTVRGGLYIINGKKVIK